MTRLFSRTVASAVVLASLAGMTMSASAAGAIVESPQNIVVWSTNSPSRDSAVFHAMARCTQEYGYGCRLRTTFSGMCMAIAVAKDGSNHFGYAIRASLREATLVAMGSCAGRGDYCTVRAQACE